MKQRKLIRRKDGVKQRYWTGRKALGKKIDIEKRKRDEEERRQRKEWADRKLYGAPRAYATSRMTRMERQALDDDDLMEDIRVYNTIKAKGEEAPYLRDSLRARGIKV